MILLTNKNPIYFKQIKLENNDQQIMLSLLLTNQYNSIISLINKKAFYLLLKLFVALFVATNNEAIH